MREINFVTSNPNKAKEVREYLKPYNVKLNIVKESIQEILSMDVEKIVRDEALQAYKKLERPCVVEHGIIAISALNGFPGGLSKLVWNTLDKRLCSFIDSKNKREARAISAIAYCDGKTIHTVLGETKGKIALTPKGKKHYYWDPIFIPDGSKKTYGEMTPTEKRKYSQAGKAWAGFIKKLELPLKLKKPPKRNSKSR